MWTDGDKGQILEDMSWMDSESARGGGDRVWEPLYGSLVAVKSIILFTNVWFCCPSWHVEDGTSQCPLTWEEAGNGFLVECEVGHFWTEAVKSPCLIFLSLSPCYVGHGKGLVTQMTQPQVEAPYC